MDFDLCSLPHARRHVVGAEALLSPRQQLVFSHFDCRKPGLDGLKIHRMGVCVSLYHPLLLELHICVGRYAVIH